MASRLLCASPLLRHSQSPFASLSVRHASSRRRPLASISSSSEPLASPRTSTLDAPDSSSVPSVTEEDPSTSSVPSARQLPSKKGLPSSLSSGPHEDLPLPHVHYEGDMKDNLKTEFRERIRPALPWFIGGILFSAVLSSSEWIFEQIKIEYWDLAYPASLWENCMPSGTDAQSATYGFELENEDWTGGIAGGTSAALGHADRGVLRTCWSRLTQGHEAGYAQQLEEHPLWQAWGSKIEQLPRNTGFQEPTERREPLAHKAGDLHTVDVTFSEAIQKTAAEGVWFPPRLPSSEEPLPLPSTALTSPRTPRPSSTVGITLLLRHARVWETMATPESFSSAKEVYERVLRSVIGWEGAETLEAGLARKLSDLSALTGEQDRGKEWALWGIERLVGWDQTGLSPISSSSTKPAASSSPAPPQAKSKSSWWPFSSSSSSSLSILLPSDSSPLSLSPIHPPISHLLSLPTAATLPPSRTRQLLSLLQSLSKIESHPSTLLTALETQTASLQFVSRLLPPDSTSLSPTEQRSDNAIPAAKLHNLTLYLAQSVFALHLAEVSFALQSSGSPAKISQSPTDLLLSSYQNAVIVHHHLTNPALTQPPQSHLFSPLTLSSYGHITSEPLPFFSSNACIASPSSSLVTSTRKTAASACHLLSSLALLSADSSSSNNPDLAKDELLRARSAAGGAMFWASERPDGITGLAYVLKPPTGIQDLEGPDWLAYYRDFKSVEEEVVKKGYGEAEEEGKPPLNQLTVLKNIATGNIPKGALWG